MGTQAALERVRELHGLHLQSSQRRARTAIGVKAGAYLWDLLTQQEARTILDLGSGFSTWVCREWAHEQECPVACVTVDHDQKWLAVTRREIEARGLSGEDFWTWEDFLLRVSGGEYGPDYFDVTFVDLHGGAQRTPAFRQIEALTPVCVFDDWQFPHVAEGITTACEELGWHVAPLPQTVDEFGRFMAEGYRAYSDD